MRLFVKTWEKDFQWLKIAMISVQKYSDNPVYWTIVIDDSTKDRFQPVIDQVRQQNPSKTLNINIYQTSDHWRDSLKIQNGYLRQQYIKMTAHRVMEKGYFWNWDSDVLAQKPFLIDDFCVHGKPIHWITQFNAIMGGSDDHAHEARKQMLRDIFGNIDISFEYMRCMPMPMMTEILKHGETSSYWTKFFNMCINAVGDCIVPKEGVAHDDSTSPFTFGILLQAPEQLFPLPHDCLYFVLFPVRRNAAICQNRGEFSSDYIMRTHTWNCVLQAIYLF